MIEIGKKFPSPKMIERIAEALGLDTPELFTTRDVVFIPGHDKSVERLYQDIMGDFDSFKKVVAEKIKEFH